MTDKEKHIEYWRISAIDDLESIDFLLSGKKYLQALFFAHLCIEKNLKALWVKNNAENLPPKTHNLISLYNSAGIELESKDIVFIQALNAFQIEGRYPDYISKMYQTITQEQTEEIVSKSKTLHLCLQEMLQ